MWNKPSAEVLCNVPKLYETEGVSLKDKIIYLHFFLEGSDWYAAEFDGDDLFFGFVILNGNWENAEWGYFSFKELVAIKFHEFETDRDLFWEVRKASEVKSIKRCYPEW